LRSWRLWQGKTRRSECRLPSLRYAIAAFCHRAAIFRIIFARQDTQKGCGEKPLFIDQAIKMNAALESEGL
jgi:hypothetical protein